MTDLDPRGIEAALREVLSWTDASLFCTPQNVDAIARSAIFAYLREALRLRPMSEAPEGAWFLVHFRGGAVLLVTRRNERRRDVITDGEDIWGLDFPDFRGWLPLPRPTDDEERA